MKVLNWTAAVVVMMALSGSSALLLAADEKTSEAKPAAAEEKAEKKAKKAKQAKQVKLVKPWNQLSSLSEDQKTRISEIHKKALEEKKAIEAREREDIMAVLNDQQKAELTKMTEEETAARKAKKGTAKKTEEKAAG